MTIKHPEDSSIRRTYVRKIPALAINFQVISELRALSWEAYDHHPVSYTHLASTSLPAFDENEEIDENAHELVKELYDLWENLNQPRLIETWHDRCV